MSVSEGFDSHLDRDQIDQDYNARATVTPAEFDRIMDDYLNASRNLGLRHMKQEGVVYDTKSGEKFDFLGPRGYKTPVVVFIHGGYWRALSRQHMLFPADLMTRHGISSIVPDYTLAPDASLSEIVRQMRAVLTYIWRNAGKMNIDRKRIYVTGSSAGGHLAAALAADGWHREAGLPSSILAGAMPVSGLFDLAPIQRSIAQEWLSLGDTEVEALSPLRHVPENGCKMTVAMAEHEATGFTRQSGSFASAWGATGAPTDLQVVGGRNHFDVILDWCEETSVLSQALLALVRD